MYNKESKKNPMRHIQPGWSYSNNKKLSEPRGVSRIYLKERRACFVSRDIIPLRGT